MTSASGTSRRSSKETLIDIKAKRAALEQKIKFSDAIDEQQKVLNKLKLQQELSETIAEETVREEALQMDELPFQLDNMGLPKETQEQFIDRFMNNTEVPPTHQTAINNLLQPVIDTSFVDTQKQSFPSLYSPTGLIHPVNNQAEKREPEVNIANSLHKNHSRTSISHRPGNNGTSTQLQPFGRWPSKSFQLRRFSQSLPASCRSR